MKVLAQFKYSSGWSEFHEVNYVETLENGEHKVKLLKYDWEGPEVILTKDTIIQKIYNGNEVDKY